MEALIRGAEITEGRRCHIMEAPSLKDYTDILEKGENKKALSSYDCVVNSVLHISPVEKTLLGKKHIRIDFVYELANTGNEVDKRKLEKGQIVLMRGKEDAVMKIFRSLINAGSVHVNSYNKDKISEMQCIHQEFSDNLEIVYDGNKQCCSFAFHRKIESVVLPRLHALSVVERICYLPTHIVRYVACHREYVAKTIQKYLASPVQTTVTTYSTPPHLVVTSGWNPQYEHVLDRVFSDLQYTEVSTSTETALYLQTIEGTKQLNTIENDCHCRITVRSLDHQVVLRSMSPRRHWLLLCHGDIQYAYGQVLVLPLCEDQVEWSPQYKHILDRGCFSTNVKNFATKIGPQKNRLAMPLKATEDETGRHLMVMYVPGPSSEKKEDYISEACKEALEFASRKKLSLALPVKLSEDLPLTGCLKNMLRAIQEHMEREDNFSDVVLYVSDASQLETLTDLSSQFLQYCKGWNVDILRREGFTCVSSHRVKIAVGELENFKADVVVNSTDPALSHVNGIVSRLILKTAGPQLQEVCRTLYPRGIEDRLLGVTETPWLQQWKEIYNIVPPQTYWATENETYLLGEMRKRVQACLTVASAKKRTSIAFPALGTGTLRYPPKKVAQTMFRAAKDFFAMMPHSSLEEITIVCFPKDIEIIKIFKTEEAVHNFKVCKSSGEDPVAFLRIGEVLLHIIATDTEVKDMPAMCDIVLDFTEDAGNATKRQNGPRQIDRAHSEKWESYKKTFEEPKKNEAVSLQIHLPRGDYADLVRYVEQWLSDCPQCLYIVMTVPDIKSLQQVVGKLKILLKRNLFFLWELESKQEVSLSYSDSAPVKDAPVICICGTSDAVQKASSEMDKIHVPDEYLQLLEQLRHPHSTDPESSMDVLPERWTIQPRKETLKLAALDSNSSEYQQVENYFRSTLGSQRWLTVLSIERVENPTLYRQYMAKKAHLDKQNSGIQNEKILWHGTSSDALSNINNYGFNRSYCGKNAVVYGQGVYFAINSNYSTHPTYSPPDASTGKRYIYQCRVLAGHTVQGNNNLRVLPVRSGHILYDSSTDNLQNPTLYVIFNDTQAYPEYLITFS